MSWYPQILRLFSLLSLLSTAKFTFIFVSSFLCLTLAFVSPSLIITTTILLCFAFAVVSGEAVKEACDETGFVFLHPQQTGSLPCVSRLQEKLCGGSGHSSSSQLPAPALRVGAPWKALRSSLPRQAYLILSSSVSAKSSSVLIKFSRCVDLWSWIADLINCDEKQIYLSEIKVNCLPDFAVQNNSSLPREKWVRGKLKRGKTTFSSS